MPHLAPRSSPMTLLTLPDTIQTTMNPDAIMHVRQTWKAVEAIAPQAAALFYDNLFTADPALVPLFKAHLKGTMEEQGKKLMLMLGIAVKELTNPQVLVPALQNLGSRHAGYGVKDEHYQTVGEALLKTLAQGLGDQFTPPVRAAWAAAYEAIAAIMKSAAHALPAAPPSRPSPSVAAHP